MEGRLNAALEELWQTAVTVSALKYLAELIREEFNASSNNAEVTEQPKMADQNSLNNVELSGIKDNKIEEAETGTGSEYCPTEQKENTEDEDNDSNNSVQFQSFVSHYLSPVDTAVLPSLATHQTAGPKEWTERPDLPSMVSHLDTNSNINAVEENMDNEEEATATCLDEIENIAETEEEDFRDIHFLASMTSHMLTVPDVVAEWKEVSVSLAVHHQQHQQEEDNTALASAVAHCQSSATRPAYQETEEFIPLKPEECHKINIDENILTEENAKEQNKSHDSSTADYPREIQNFTQDIQPEEQDSTKTVLAKILGIEFAVKIFFHQTTEEEIQDSMIESFRANSEPSELHAKISTVCHQLISTDLPCQFSHPILSAVSHGTPIPERMEQDFGLQPSMLGHWSGPETSIKEDVEESENYWCEAESFNSGPPALNSEGTDDENQEDNISTISHQLSHQDLPVEYDQLLVSAASHGWQINYLPEDDLAPSRICHSIFHGNDQESEEEEFEYETEFSAPTSPLPNFLWMAYTSIQNYLSSQEASPEPQVIVEEPEENASIIAANVKGVEFQIKVFFHQKSEECSELSSRDNNEPYEPSGGITVVSHQLQSTNFPCQYSQPILSAISHGTSFEERAIEYDSGIQASMVSHLSGLETSEEEDEENCDITLLSDQEARINEEPNTTLQNYCSSHKASPEPKVRINEEAEDEDFKSIITANVKGVEFQIKVVFHQKFEGNSEETVETSEPTSGISHVSHQLPSTDLPYQFPTPILSAISHETSFQERADEFDSGIQTSILSHWSGLETEAVENKERINITVISEEATTIKDTCTTIENYVSSREASPEIQDMVNESEKNDFKSITAHVNGVEFQIKVVFHQKFEEQSNLCDLLHTEETSEQSSHRSPEYQEFRVGKPEEDEDQSNITANVNGVEFQIKVHYHQKFEEASEEIIEVPHLISFFVSHQLPSSDPPAVFKDFIQTAAGHGRPVQEKAGEELGSWPQSSMLSHCSMDSGGIEEDLSKMKTVKEEDDILLEPETNRCEMESFTQGPSALNSGEEDEGNKKENFSFVCHQLPRQDIPAEYYRFPVSFGSHGWHMQYEPDDHLPTSMLSHCIFHGSVPEIDDKEGDNMNQTVPHISNFFWMATTSLRNYLTSQEEIIVDEKHIQEEEIVWHSAEVAETEIAENETDICSRNNQESMVENNTELNSGMSWWQIDLAAESKLNPNAVEFTPRWQTQGQSQSSGTKETPLSSVGHQLTVAAVPSELTAPLPSTVSHCSPVLEQVEHTSSSLISHQAETAGWKPKEFTEQKQEPALTAVIATREKELKTSQEEGKLMEIVTVNVFGIEFDTEVSIKANIEEEEKFVLSFDRKEEKNTAEEKEETDVELPRRFEESDISNSWEEQTASEEEETSEEEDCYLLQEEEERLLSSYHSSLSRIQQLQKVVEVELEEFKNNKSKCNNTVSNNTVAAAADTVSLTTNFKGVEFKTDITFNQKIDATEPDKEQYDFDLNEDKCKENMDDEGTEFREGYSHDEERLREFEDIEDEIFRSSSEEGDTIFRADSVNSVIHIPPKEADMEEDDEGEEPEVENVISASFTIGRVNSVSVNSCRISEEKQNGREGSEESGAKRQTTPTRPTRRDTRADTRVRDRELMDSLFADQTNHRKMYSVQTKETKPANEENSQESSKKEKRKVSSSRRGAHEPGKLFSVQTKETVRPTLPPGKPQFRIRFRVELGDGEERAAVKPGSGSVLRYLFGCFRAGLR